MVLDPGTLQRIPAGTVRLRDARRGTGTEVHLEPFELARTPVTEAGEDRPLRAITWFDAVRLCNQLSDQADLPHAYAVDGRRVHWDLASDGYRLPTEAEWEHACRAGTTGAHYGPVREIAWTVLDGIDDVRPVGRKQPNDFGLSDMLGNVWEWCWDYLDPARYADYRVFRGGGWADPPWSVRASVRRGSAPDAALESSGLRIARGVVGERGARAAQGWSAIRDRERAGIRGPLPMGWTPLRELLDDEERSAENP